MTVDLPDSLVAYLEVLVKTGLYGPTVDECASRLISQAIEDKMHGPMASTVGRAMDRRGATR